MGKKPKKLKKIIVLTALTAVILCGANTLAGYNYLQNADMEFHWEVAPVMNLQYTGPGTDCRLNIDVTNHRFQTIVDGQVDIDIDLSDRYYFEEQYQVIAYLNATGNYTASSHAWNGRNRGCDGWGATQNYSDGWNGAVNLKDPGGKVGEGSPSHWGCYNGSSNGASMFAHSGKYSLGVWDNRPDSDPNGPLQNNSESIHYYQDIVQSNPDHYTELLGKAVTISGWAYMPSNSWQNDLEGDGYLIRIHHGVGGATVTDFETPNVVKDQWNYFEHTFTVDPASDMIKIVLFAEPTINQVYHGNGSVFFDDMSVELSPAYELDLSNDDIINLADLKILAAGWLQIDEWIPNHPFMITAASAVPEFLDVDEYFGANFTCFSPYGSASQIGTVAAEGKNWLGTFHINWNDPFDPDDGAIDWIAGYESGSGGNLGWGWILADEVIGTWMTKMGSLFTAYKERWPDKPTCAGSTGLTLNMDYVYGGAAPPGYDADTYLDDLVSILDPDIIASVGMNLSDDPDNNADHDLWFFNTMKVRQKILESNLEFYTWVQAYEVIAENIRFPSESDIRAMAYAAVTAGSKGILYGGYSGWHDKSILNNSGAQTSLYADVTSLNSELAKQGLVLRKLTSTDVRFIPGYHNPGPAANSTPNELTNWSVGAGSDPLIVDVSIVDAATTNAHIDKNALIGFFEDDSGNKAFMVTNLYHGGSLSAAAAQLPIHLEFDPSITSIYKLSTSTGQWVPVTVQPDHTIDITLPGGTGELFAYTDFDFQTIATPSTEYLVNGDMEYHWGVTPVLNLDYTGPGAECLINVDVENGRLQTIVDGIVDLDIDITLTDLGGGVGGDPNVIEEQFQLKNLIEATGNYTVTYPGWNGLNRGGEAYSPVTDYSDSWNGLHNLKVETGSLVEGLPSAWGTTTASTSGACVISHSGKYSLQVYDNRPDQTPGTPLVGSPESVSVTQDIVAGNPGSWDDLLGEEVILSGWVYMPSTSYQNETIDQGYTIRMLHGVGGAEITDFSSNPGRDQWVYFEHNFTVDPASDTIKIILMASLNPDYVYNGVGCVYFDDMSLKLASSMVTAEGDFNNDSIIDWFDFAILAKYWQVEL